MNTTTEGTRAPAAGTRPRCACGGKLVTEQYFALGEWHETIVCLICGHEPGVRRPPTAEERQQREGDARRLEERVQRGIDRGPRGGREQLDETAYRAERRRLERRRQERKRAQPAPVAIDSALDEARALERREASIAADPQQQAERERARAMLDAEVASRGLGAVA